MLPKRGAGGIFDVARANGKGAGHMGLGLPEAAVREKGAGRRGRGQEKVQVCLLERRADGIWVLRRGTSGAVPAVISQPHGPLGPGVFCLVYIGRNLRQSWG